MTILELYVRLCGRAETARRNAQTYESSGYRAEALLQYAKADAYALAAEDAQGESQDISDGRTTIHAADRFEALAWAGIRPDVLRLLMSLRRLNWDPAAVGHLLRIVEGRAA